MTNPTTEEPDYSKLLSEDSITKVRKEAEKTFEPLTSDQYQHLRRRAKLDLFFLCTAILDFDKLSTKLHGHLCWWMVKNRRARFKEILMPRSHFKSTIATIGHGIQLSLPAIGFEEVASWPESLGPEIRALIGHETLDQASKFLFAIQSHFLQNPKLMGLFPELVPSPKQHRINRYELELPRKGKWSEATYTTMGVGGKSQGKHFDYLKLDDLIGDKARDSQAEMSRAKDWIDNIQAFFTEFTKAKLDIVGTRWAYDDLYNHLHITYGPALLKYIRSAEEFNPKTGKLEPIFPEAFTTESFAILKRNKKVWASQYVNNPELVAVEFEKSWKQYFEWEGYNRLKIGEGDLVEKFDVMDMDRCILIDPAMSGPSGIVVTGGTGDDKIFCLESTQEEFKPPELVDYLFKLVARWQPRVVAIEEVLFSGLFEPWLKREQQIRGIRFNIQPVSTSQKSKEARVRGLTNYFAAGCIFFHKSQEKLEEQFDRFGATDDYHILDALAQGPLVWSKPFSAQRWSDLRQAEELILSERDLETGY